MIHRSAYAWVETPFFRVSAQAAKPPIRPSHADELMVLSDGGIAEVPYEGTEIVELTRAFLDGREQFLRHLFED